MSAQNEPAAEAPPADNSEATDAEQVAEAEAAVEVDIEKLLAEREQYRDIALRLQADFENYRKRADKQRVDDVDRAMGRVVEDLLAVLDACELAAGHGVEGIEPVWSALYGALKRHGLEAMNPSGSSFDPEQHEAVMHEPSDDATVGPVVADVMRTGYLWKGKTLRPAMVKVRG
ncbi:MAG: nucleotide exchange factor GrpE [Acidimicrobiia bacterium]